MARPKHRTILLTGAPRSSSLTYEDTLLSTDLLPCFRNAAVAVVESVEHAGQAAGPTWRSLPLEKAHWPTSLTPAYDRFLSNGLDTIGPPSSNDTEVLSQYYEQSFAVHEAESLQILTSSQSELDDTSFVSMDDVADSDALQSSARLRLQNTHLTRLKDLPSAKHLQSIVPQTATASMVVGIISRSQPRTITTRKTQNVVELVDLLVGDDSRAGFSINIWLSAAIPPEACARLGPISTAEQALRQQTMSLRPRDIILARNVALGSFKGKVDGQSLRRGMTSLDVLYRPHVIAADDQRGAFSARDLAYSDDANVAAVKQVRDWILDFVGPRRHEHRSKHDHVDGIEYHISPLPLDTQ